MKFQVAVIVLCYFIVASYSRPADDKYSSRYDNLDVKQILRSDRLLTNYVNCFMDRGSCTQDGVELKGLVKEALETECSKCSEIQKEKSREVLGYLSTKKPDMWNELADKYDPTGVFRVKYETELETLRNKKE